MGTHTPLIATVIGTVLVVFLVVAPLESMFSLEPRLQWETLLSGIMAFIAGSFVLISGRQYIGHLIKSDAEKNKKIYFETRSWFGRKIEHDINRINFVGSEILSWIYDPDSARSQLKGPPTWADIGEISRKLPLQIEIPIEVDSVMSKSELTKLLSINRYIDLLQSSLHHKIRNQAEWTDKSAEGFAYSLLDQAEKLKELQINLTEPQ